MQKKSTGENIRYINEDVACEVMQLSLQFPLTCKEHSVVTSVNFSPSEPHDYVVTSGSKVSVE